MIADREVPQDLANLAARRIQANISQQSRYDTKLVPWANDLQNSRPSVPTGRKERTHCKIYGRILYYKAQICGKVYDNPLSSQHARSPLSQPD